MKIKKVYQKRFTTVDNTVLNDTELSWKAKGLFVYLWSQADEWEFYETEVVKHSTDGIRSMRAGLHELEEKGYLSRKRERVGNRLKGSIWLLSETPQKLQNVTLQNDSLQNVNLQNSTLTNTNNNNTNYNNKLTTTTGTTEIGSIYEFWESNVGSLSPYLYEEIQAIYDDWKEVSKQPKEMILESIKMALDKGVRNISYVKSILKRWYDNRIYNIEDLKADQERFEKNKQRKSNSKSKKSMFIDAADQDHSKSDEEAWEAFWNG
ncbi:DnaD domain protein [Ligilactobacillus salivarius]|uniref:DnaD domain-containing protein n=1 Tax=Ligilactobacillus salivarius TaxID=1624 RepID=UPI00177B8C97|nr:DnaD domain protein [Ligilactobacillus salivarius]QXL48879.1 DnaD domain protein [Ligilactobacillus salivarius]